MTRIWSHTSLSLYATCPAAWRAKDRGEPSLTPQNLADGRDLHEAIARYAAACYPSRRGSDQDAADQIGRGYSPVVQRAMKAFAEDVRWPWDGMDDWLEICSDDTHGLPVERTYTAALPNGDLFTGRIDLLYTEKGALRDNPFAESADEVVIVDWKLYDGSGHNGEPPLQLRRYAWLVQQLRPEARAFRLMIGSPGWEGRWRTVAWTIDGDLDEVGQEIVAMSERIKADSTYEPRPGPGTCPTCLYAAVCPLRETATLRVLTETPTHTLAQAYPWHQAQASLALRILKQRAEAEGGRLAMGDEVWGYRARTSLVPVDVAAVREACAAAGRDYTELLGSFSKRQVQKAIGEGWLSDGLFAEKVVGRTFGPLSQGGEDDDNG